MTIFKRQNYDFPNQPWLWYQMSHRHTASSKNLTCCPTYSWMQEKSKHLPTLSLNVSFDNADSDINNALETKPVNLLWPRSAWSDVVPGICGLCQTFFHLNQLVSKMTKRRKTIMVKMFILMSRNHKSITIHRKNQSQPTFGPSAWDPCPPLSVARGLKCAF